MVFIILMSIEAIRGTLFFRDVAFRRRLQSFCGQAWAYVKSWRRMVRMQSIQRSVRPREALERLWVELLYRRKTFSSRVLP